MVNKIRYYTADANTKGVPPWLSTGLDCLEANVGTEAATGEPAGPTGATTAAETGGAINVADCPFAGRIGMFQGCVIASEIIFQNACTTAGAPATRKFALALAAVVNNVFPPEA